MSEYGIFESVSGSEDEGRIAKQASTDRLAAAVYDVREKHGQWLFGAKDLDSFNDRVALAHTSICQTIEPHLHARTGVQRKVIKTLEREWRQRQARPLPRPPIDPAFNDIDFDTAVDQVDHAQRGESWDDPYEGRPYVKGTPRKQACYPGCDENEAHAAKFHKDKGDEKEARRRRADNTGPVQDNRGDFGAYLDSVDDGAEGKIDHDFVGEGTRHDESGDHNFVPTVTGGRRQAGEHCPSCGYSKGHDPTCFTNADAPDFNRRTSPSAPNHGYEEGGGWHEPGWVAPPRDREASAEFNLIARLIQADDVTGGDPAASMPASPVTPGDGVPAAPAADMAGNAGSSPISPAPAPVAPTVTAAVLRYANWCLAMRVRPHNMAALDRYAAKRSDREYFILADAIQKSATGLNGGGDGTGGGKLGDTAGNFVGSDLPPGLTSSSPGWFGVDKPGGSSFVDGPAASSKISRRRTAAPDYLQKADEALSNLLNQKAEEFQESVQALQQALMTVQQAEQMQQAQNPLNVLPPAGTVNVMPGGGDPSQGGGDPSQDPSQAQALLQGGGAAAGGAPPQDPSQQMMARRRQAAGQEVKWEGKSCPDCAMVIANDDDSGNGPDWSREKFHQHTQGIPGEGPLVIGGDEAEFGRGPCDTCGSPYDGDFHKVVRLGPRGKPQRGASRGRRPLGR